MLQNFFHCEKKTIARQPRLLCSIKLEAAHLPALRESAFQRSPFRTDVEQPNLPLFSLELPPPLLAALRWTPAHSKYCIYESALRHRRCELHFISVFKEKSSIIVIKKSCEFRENPYFTQPHHRQSNKTARSSFHF